MFYGAHLYVFAVLKTMFCHNKSAYYKVIPDYRETYSVFSIQFFRCCFHPLYR